MSLENAKENLKEFGKELNLELVFDENNNELFQWGPRPNEAQELVTRLKAEGKTKTEFLEQLHLWYGRNRGKVLESEMIELLNSL